MGKEKNVACSLSLFDTLLMGGIFMKNTKRRSLALIVALVVMVSVFAGISFEPIKAAEGTTYTSLKGVDVLHVGDVLDLDEDIEFFLYDGSLSHKYTWTLVRADITQNGKGTQPIVTESETGKYYVFKGSGSAGYFVPLSSSGRIEGYEQVIFYTTEISEGLKVSIKDGKYNFTVHDNAIIRNLVIADNIKNGSVKSSTKKYAAKTTVRLTVTPDETYELKDGSLKVIYGKNVIYPEHSETDTYKYTFIMPDADVTVTAEFVKKNNSGKQLEKNEKVNPTCTTDGHEEFWYSPETHEIFSDEEGKNQISYPVIKATGHDWGEWTVTKPATDTEDGEETRICKNDSSHIETRPIPALNPEVDKDYSVSFNSKFKVSQTKKKITVYWNKVNGAEYYEVYVALNGKEFSNVTAKADKTKKKISISKVDGKKLKLTKVYNVKVIAYDGEGKVIAESIEACVVGVKNTKYTNPKAVKITSKTKVTLKVGKTSEITANLVPYDEKKVLLPESYGKEFRYVSSDEKVATVENGVITAVGKGSCTIYVYAKNGYAAKVTVKVK